MLVRPDRVLGMAVQLNCFEGEVVGEIDRGPNLTLLIKLLGDPLRLGRDHDLHVDLPTNVYYRLGVDSDRRWTVSLKREAVHVIGPVSADKGQLPPARSS